MKKCPPGVICIENITMVLVIIICFIILYGIHSHMNKTPNVHVNNNERIIIKEKQEQSPGYGSGYGFGFGSGYGFFTRPNYGYTNLPGDVLMNPYVPPLRDERYGIPVAGIPINIPTNPGSVDTSYRQVGLLTPIQGPNKILPLMGRPLFVNRDKWQYYTMSDQNNSVKLPLIRNGRSCTNEYGCDKLYSGDRVFVEGYNDGYKITMYENDTIRYIPYL